MTKKMSSIQKCMNIINTSGDIENAMIVVEGKNNNASFAAHGDIRSIGKVIFTAMFAKESSDIAEDIFLMVRDIATNLISQNTQYAIRLLDIIAEHAGAVESGNVETKILKLNINDDELCN